MPPSSAEVLSRLSDLHPKMIDLSLGRIERLLDAIGRPQDHLPPVVHVAGTNGKGSVIAFLRAMVEAAGLRAHVYTSPHLVRLGERVVLGSREIDDRALAALLDECGQRNGGRPITVFEILTAAAFLAFAREPADVVLLETGLGGRLDATNVVTTPAVTAVTPISLDHQAFLGETLAEIAFEKAGILKPVVPCVLAAQDPLAAAVVRARASEVGATVSAEGVDWRVSSRPGALVFADDTSASTLPAPALEGAHQVGNAGIAIACARILSMRLPGLTQAAIAGGLRGARWPARLQRLDHGRLAPLLPPGWELWLDGGHNPAAGSALARHCAGWSDRPLFVVFGMLRTKDAAGFLRPLVPYPARLIAVPVPDEATGLGAEEGASIAEEAGIEAEAAASVEEALRRLAAIGERPSRILICGSLYLAGHVLADDAGI